MTSLYFYDLNGTYVTVIDQHPQLTVVESYYPASQCLGNSNYDLFTVASSAVLTFTGCILADIRVQFHTFAIVDGFIAFTDTQILRMDFFSTFLSSTPASGSATVVFDNSFVTGWNRDHPLLNIPYPDAPFITTNLAVDVMIRHSLFEDNYELLGTLLSSFAFLSINGDYIEITDSVFLHCMGAIVLISNALIGDVAILMRNVTIDSSYSSFSSTTLQLMSYSSKQVLIYELHILNCLGFDGIVSLATSYPTDLANSEFINNRLFDEPLGTTVLGIVGIATILSNCKFINNGAYSASYAPFFFYNRLLSLGLINPYPQINDFFALFTPAQCSNLMEIFTPVVNLSNITISSDLGLFCTYGISLAFLQDGNVCNFTSVLIAGGSTYGITDIENVALPQTSIMLKDSVFSNLSIALSFQSGTVLANNLTFFNINAAAVSDSPITMSGGSAYFEHCYFISGSGLTSGAVFMSAVGTSNILSVKNCEFDGNAASTGATDVAVWSSTGSESIIIEIKDSVFRNQLGATPNCALQIKGVIIQSGNVLNCTFTSTHDIAMGLILLGQTAGTFYISDTLFDSINAPGEILISFFTGVGAVNLVLDNVTVRNCVFDSCLQALDSSYVYLHSCTFEFNTGIVLWNKRGHITDNASFFHGNSNERSPCLYQEMNSVSVFHASSFHSNKASQIGVTQIIGPSSFVTFENCTFVNNSVTELTGVMQLTGSPIVYINNCSFWSNSAPVSSVFLFERVLSEVVIANSIFRQNIGSGLLKAVYSKVVMQNVTFTDMDITEKDYLITLVSNSNLTLQNSTVHSLQGILGQGGCFLSIFMSSTAAIRSTSISDVQCQQDIISVMLRSILSVEDSTFSNVSSSIAGVISSSAKGQLRLTSTRFSNISVSQGVLFTHQVDVSVVSSVFHTVKGAMVLHTERCTSVLIQSTSVDTVTADTSVGVVQSVGCATVLIKYSNFTDINATTTAGIQAYNGNVTVDYCLFTQMSAGIHGAIEIEGGNLIITQSRFLENSARSAIDSFGGAVYVNTPSSSSISIANNTFTRNTAVAGGAVYWNSAHSMSKLQGNNAYEGNAALYGNDTAYSAFKLRVRSSSLPVLASGQTYNGEISIEIVDQLGQLVTTDSTSKVVMVLWAGYSLTGNLVATASQGIFSLSDFIVTGIPGTNADVTIVPNAPNCLNVSLILPLRHCVIGEIQMSSGACMRCSDGTYSLTLTGSSCFGCFPEAICRDGSMVYPNPGFWRPEDLYDGLFACPNSGACENTPSQTSTTGICAQGYTGNMCQSCADGYSRSGEDKCAECPSLAMNIIRLSITGVALCIFVGILVRSAWKSATTKNSYVGVYMKILMNYLHMTILIANFSLNWPSVLEEMFNIHSYLGSSGEQFMSLDCVLPQAYFTKLAIAAILPMALLIANVLLWALFHLILHVQYVSKKLICSMIVSLFYVHPMIVKIALSAFHCITIKPGELWLRDEMDIACLTSTHLTYSLGAALPTLIVWGFGIPTAALLLLIKNRKRLSLLSVKQEYGFLITGYRSKTYFWEVAIAYRKVSIILLYVFMSNEPISLQSLSLCMLLWAAGSLQSRFQAFQTAELNRLEQRSLWVCILTIYSGMVFSTKALLPQVELAITVLLILANAYFLAMLLYLIFRAYLTKFAKNHPRVARYLPCLHITEMTPIEERSSVLPLLKKQLYLAKLHRTSEELTIGLD